MVIMKHKLLKVCARVSLLALLGFGLIGFLTFNSSVAHAQDGNSITVGDTAQLIGKVALRIPVTVTCTIPENAMWPYTRGQATISQSVSGNTITSATGEMWNLTCDGTAHTYQVEMSPTAGSSSLHAGPAVAIASFYISYNDPNTYTYTSDSGNTGYVPIRIKNN
jgi:hypothetical protein